MQNPEEHIVSIKWKRPTRSWFTCCLKSKVAICQHEVETAWWTMTHTLFKNKIILLSASCRKGLLDPDLQAVQNPDHCIVSIMQKRPPWPWLTSCSKPRPFYCQHHAEKASWTLTHILFKTQTISLSASCRKGLLVPDLHTVQNPDHSIVSTRRKGLLVPDLHTVQNPRPFYCQHHAERAFWTLTYILLKTQTILLSASCRKCLLDPDLHAVQNPNHSIVSIMQKRPPRPWLTFCSKPRPFHCQHEAEKHFLDPDLHAVQNPDPPIVNIMQKRHPGPWLTFCSKPRPFYCQHHAKKASWTLTYKLFKTQTILLSESCRKGFLDPDLHPVQNPDHCIVSIMQKRHGSWLTACSKPRPFYCQHHREKVPWTLTYMLFKTQTTLLSASCRKGLLDPDLQAVQNPDHSIVSIMQKRPPGPWLTGYSKPRPFYCQHHAEKASWTLTYMLFKIQTILLSASCRKGLLDPDLHPVQNPDHSIVNIMQKMPPGPWLTSCSKPRPFYCQDHAKKASWTLTYMLFKTQTILLSASYRKGLLVPDLHAVQNPDHCIVSIMQKRPPGS